jgi:hypothetical protein
MTTQITLTQAQADALKSAIRTLDADDVIRLHSSDSFEWRGSSAALKNVPLKTLALALYVGYDVEKTAEERIRERYEEEKAAEDSYIVTEDFDRSRRHLYYRKGIYFTLDTLGIKIGGVNV